jgi:hypothetical protein
MTKRREFGSRFDAFTISCLEIGWDKAAEALGLSVPRLRKIGDPDQDGEPTIKQGMILDMLLKCLGLEPYNAKAFGAGIGDKPRTPEAQAERVLDEALDLARLVDEVPGSHHAANQKIIEAAKTLLAVSATLLKRHEENASARVIDMPKERRA